MKSCVLSQNVNFAVSEFKVIFVLIKHSVIQFHSFLILRLVNDLTVNYGNLTLGFSDSSVDKETACNAGDLGFDPWVGEGKDYPLQYSGLENSMDCIVQGVAKSWTQLSDFPYNQTMLLLSRFSRVRLCATPQTAAHQAPPSLGFSRQEHWSGLPFPSPMILRIVVCIC